MKLFSRKALVAGAAAVALSFAGTSAAVAAEETTTPSEAPAPGEGQTPGEPGEPGDNDGQNNNGNGGSSSNNGDDENDKDENKGSSDMDPKDISAWISVFTAVIGALGALFSFATKYLGFKL